MRHDKYEDYPDYGKREDVKQEGWVKMGEAKTVEEKAWYLLHHVIWSHYWRAREALESRRNEKTLLKKIMGSRYYPGYVLDIDHYTCHWLGANGDRRDLFSEDVVKFIEEEYFYKAEKNKYMKDGMTMYWECMKEGL